MRTVEATALIHAAPQQVWDLYADVEGSVEWVPFVEQVTYVSGPADLGQTYRERTRLGGIRSTSEWKIVEWDPPRRQVQLSHDMRMESRLVIEIESNADGTRLRQSTVLRSRLPGPFRGLHEVLFAVFAGWGIRQAVAAAKRRLESA